MMRYCVAVLSAFLLASNLAACSVVMPLPSMFGRSDTTGTIKPTKVADARPLVLPSSSAAGEIDAASSFGEAFEANDWIAAQPALSQALALPPHLQASVPWYDPKTGASGTFKQQATTLSSEIGDCRDFSASIDGADGEHDLLGRACRDAQGSWRAREMLPSTPT